MKNVQCQCSLLTQEVVQKKEVPNMDLEVFNLFLIYFAVTTSFFFLLVIGIGDEKKICFNLIVFVWLCILENIQLKVNTIP